MENKLREWELEELDNEDLEQEKERFTIEDMDQLTWAFRKIKAIREKKQEIRDLADKEIERIEAWATKETGQMDNNESFFQGLIMEYALKKRREDPKFKSEKTPYGRVTFKKQQPKWIYDDEKLTEYLLANKKFDLIKTESKPIKPDIKKLYTVQNGRLVDQETGEVVEGVTIQEQEEKIDVKPE